MKSAWMCIGTASTCLPNAHRLPTGSVAPPIWLGKEMTLNLSQCVARKHWGRRCASPRRFSANLLEIGGSQRWLLAAMPPNFDLLQTAIDARTSYEGYCRALANQISPY